MLKMTRTLIPGLFLLAGLPAFAGTAADDVHAMDPYARAMPPVAKMSASFMTLMNKGDSHRKLVAAHSDVAKNVELHTHINDNGVMRMRQIPHIDIPAQGKAVLKPGGLHVMLIGLNQTMVAGEEIQVELEFADGSRKTITAPVRKVGMAMKHNKDMHKHDMHMKH